MSLNGELRLNLVGCIKLVDNGFALPVYATRHLPNTFYVAKCSPIGDHSGQISAFEPTLIDEDLILPIIHKPLVQVGDNWIDVLVWDKKVYVGNSVNLWRKIRGITHKMTDLAPLTLFDLAVDNDYKRIDLYGKITSDYISKYADLKAVNRWKRQALQNILYVSLDRLLLNSNSRNTSVRESDIFWHERGTSIYVEIPKNLVTEIRNHPLYGQIVPKISRLAKDLGLIFVRLESQTEPWTPDKITLLLDLLQQKIEPAKIASIVGGVTKSDIENAARGFESEPRSSQRVYGRSDGKYPSGVRRSWFPSPPDEDHK